MRKKKSIYNIISNLILQIFIIAYGFIVPKIIISFYGSETNGLISSITQFLGYISLLESGFGPVVRASLYKPLAKKNNDEIIKILKASEKFFRKLSFIFIIYIVILIFIYPIFINNEFSFIYTASLIIIISISTFAEYFFGMTYRLYLKASQSTYVVSIIQMVTYALSVIFTILLANMGFNIQIVKLVSGLIFIIRPLAQNLYVKKKYKIFLKSTKSNYNIKNKWDGLAQHIAAVIHSNTDITVLTIFSSLIEVSVYSVYYMVIKGIKQIIESFSNGVDASWGDMIAKNETENIREKFDIYEILYFTIATIMFSCTLLLITPFISVYTVSIHDANYIRYTFGYLLVISEYLWAIRLPYSSITLAAGHFKETRIGAWIEAMLNITLSIILVWKFGLIGATIGTIIAMFIRTAEFVYHTNKYIIKRSIFSSLYKIFILIGETIIICYLYFLLCHIKVTSYITWGYSAIITLLISCCVTFGINFIFYHKQLSKIRKNSNMKKINFIIRNNYQKEGSNI